MWNVKVCVVVIGDLGATENVRFGSNGAMGVWGAMGSVSVGGNGQWEFEGR